MNQYALVCVLRSLDVATLEKLLVIDQFHQAIISMQSEAQLVYKRTLQASVGTGMSLEGYYVNWKLVWELFQAGLLCFHYNAGDYEYLRLGAALRLHHANTMMYNSFLATLADHAFVKNDLEAFKIMTPLFSHNKTNNKLTTFSVWTWVSDKEETIIHKDFLVWILDHFDKNDTYLMSVRAYQQSCADGSLETVKMLEDRLSKTILGSEGLVEAIKGGHLDVVKFIMARSKISINLNGYLFLRTAISANRLEIFYFLMELIRPNDDLSVLVDDVCSAGCCEVFELLRKRGCFRGITNWGRLFCKAAVRNNTGILLLMLEHCEIDSMFFHTAVLEAFKWESAEAVKFLVKQPRFDLREIDIEQRYRIYLLTTITASTC